MACREHQHTSAPSRIAIAGVNDATDTNAETEVKNQYVCYRFVHYYQGTNRNCRVWSFMLREKMQTRRTLEEMRR